MLDKNIQAVLDTEAEPIIKAMLIESIVTDYINKEI